MRMLKVIGVGVFLEKRKTRVPVGVLQKEGKDFVFTYNDRYFRMRNVIPLGPEFPLTQQQFRAKELFPSLVDRIPSRRNPAYPEYCQMMGIDPQENDPFILLSTIGRRGPSSFVFSPIFERKVVAQDLVEFRKRLGLTTREFAAVFELSQASLNAFERGRSSGKDLVKRLDVLLHFPAVALDLLLINGGHLMHEKWVHAVKTLEAMAKKDLS